MPTNDIWYFEDNKDKYTVEMLDEKIEEGSDVTLREYIEYYISCGYLDEIEDFTKLTTREISRLVDWIDYLESK